MKCAKINSAAAQAYYHEKDPIDITLNTPMSFSIAALFEHSTKRQGVSEEHVHSVVTGSVNCGMTSGFTREVMAKILAKHPECKVVVYDFDGLLEDYYKDQQ